MKTSLIVLATIMFSVIVASLTTWIPDNNHIQLHFSATHFGIAHIEGIFTSFRVSMISEKEDFTDAQIEMSADVKSITTNVQMRDDDLRSSNWFDAEHFPTLDFKSTSFKKLRGKNYALSGNITFHGVTRPITFAVLFNGWAVTMTKRKTAGFTITGSLKRSDFNLGDIPLLTGVSDEIEVRANAEIGKSN